MQAGQKLVATFFENTGGLNLTDSTFAVKPGQAVGGYNYDYVRTGGIQKSLAPSRINAVANAQLRTLGLFLRNPKSGAKSIVRAAGTKIQLVDLTGNFTDLPADDSAAGTNFLTAGSEQPVVGVMTTTPATDVLWLAGGGMDSVHGAVGSEVTSNGVPAPEGTLTLTESGGGGFFQTVGPFYYAVQYRKRSTKALSNAALDQGITLSATTNSVMVTWALTNPDTTQFDEILIYRSSPNGTAQFTAGDLIAELDSTETSYTDTGTYLATSQNIPRAGNTILDNSVLPDGTYNTLTLFKRRLVTASGSTVYLSDLNKFESWPLTNVIEVPSGGPITALAIVSFTTPSATTTDEFLVVFKETEIWVITGDDYTTWSLKWVDSTGCLGQPLVVSANGYLYFIDNRGIYLWDGAGKPVYLSRPIEDLFGVSGKIDRSKLWRAFGTFFRRQNEVVWCLTNTDIGEQRYLLKLDLRLTLPNVSNTLGQRIVDGVFVPGKIANSAWAGASFVFPTASNQEDVFISGDDEGYLYRQFYSTEGVGSDDYDFTYRTKFLDFERPGITKSYKKVIAWVENVGNWDLLLDYWTDFRTSDNDKQTVPATINKATDGKVALWDVAKWDQAKWDGYQATPKAIVFNLRSANANNGQGEVLQLQFRQQGSDEPVTIYGFSVVYSETAMRL